MSGSFIQVRAEPMETSVEVRINMEEIRTEDMLDELERRSVLRSEEVEVLKQDQDLYDHYEEKFEKPAPKISDLENHYFDDVRSLIMRADLPEALLQIERMHAGFDGLVRLFERGGKR